MGCFNLLIGKCDRVSMVLHNLNPGTQEREAGGSLEFQDNQSYTGKLCLRKKDKRKIIRFKCHFVWGFFAHGCVGGVLRQGFLCVKDLPVLDSLQRTGWPRTQRSACLCLLSVGLKACTIKALVHCDYSLHPLNPLSQSQLS